MNCKSLLALLTLTLLFSCSEKKEDNNIEVDDSSSITISTSSSTVDESIGNIILTYEVNSSKVIDTAITIHFSTSGTATSGSDFSIDTNTITIDKNTSSSQLTMKIINDSIGEDNETIVISIDSINPTDLISEIATNFTLTITDDSGIETTDCPNDNSTQKVDIGCGQQPSVVSEYTETVSSDIRTIESNNYPNHSFQEANSAQRPVVEVDHTYSLDATPTLAASNTSILKNNNRPDYIFGVAINGVIIDPAPAEPFIFTNTSTNEYNWDWVFEPTNNIGSGSDYVSLDCNSAHVSTAEGYHYHGLMYGYADTLLAGLGSGSTTPTSSVQLGWAADGFPILYIYGPDGNSNITKLQPSYQLKSGNREGDGISEPCGAYTGKYTEDYEYIEGLGDLDECNGIERSITLTTAQGSETFSYFYVITEDFPVIGRFFRGTPNSSFDK